MDVTTIVDFRATGDKALQNTIRQNTLASTELAAIDIINEIGRQATEDTVVPVLREVIRDVAKTNHISL